MIVAEKNVECLKLTKEIDDLNVEMETVQKMYLEKNIHNMVNKIPPSTYYEYVNSVYIFLDRIKAKKKLELVKKL